MKALEKLTNSISDSTKRTIILWGNLYKGTVPLNKKPTIEDLINIIEPPESFTEEIETKVMMLFSDYNDRDTFLQRSKDLIEVYTNKYKVAVENLVDSADQITLKKDIIDLFNLNVQNSQVGRELFAIKKGFDPKEYTYKVRKKIDNEYQELRDPVSHEESLKPIYDQSWVRVIDSNSNVTHCHTFELDALVSDLIHCIYNKAIIEAINNLVDDCMITGDYDSRPVLINSPDAIRRILDNSKDKKWKSSELCVEVDTKFKRLGPKAELRVFKKDLNNAISRLAKQYPNRIEVDESKRRNFKK